ncbi:MAG: glycosyltransferase family 4 protein [Alphaproteobacteria bacterium]
MSRHGAPQTSLRIAIAAAGRFHALDLARELHALGHRVMFYSYVPRSRARAFALPDECAVSLLPFALPILAWQRLAPRFLPRLRERLMYAALNRGVILRLRRCDVFVCMSGIYLEAARFARWRYGAKIWLERGSRHILSQLRILAGVDGAEQPSRFTVRRELAGYEMADRIVVPSIHAEESFAGAPHLRAKLFRNPYGVDLGMFPASGAKEIGETIGLLYVGTWSLQKGCDLLENAVRGVDGVRLTHVGAIGDLRFPDLPERFAHRDPVAQPALKEFYAEADLFVLASRQDGFGMVLSQALASGLPIVCTDRTGGIDLARMPGFASRITVVSAGDAHALAEAIRGWRDRLRGGGQPPALGDDERQRLSWAAYARRYNAELLAHAAGPVT